MSLSRLLPKSPSASHHLIRPLTTSTSLHTTTINWKGRHPDEHAVNRTDELDVQSKPSHQAMREKERHSENKAEAGKEDSLSQGITEKDEKASNKRAKEELSPKAPGPVIGMNDERGQKGH